MTRLSKGRLIACVVALLTGCICAIVPLRGMIDVRADHERTRRLMQQDFATKQARAANLEAYRQQLEEMKDMLRGLLLQLPSRYDETQIMQMLREQTALSGLSLDSVRRGEETKKDFYAQLPYDIRLTGTAAALDQFLQRLPDQAQVLNLRKLNVMPRQGQSTVSIEATLLYFRYLSDDE